MKAVNNIFHKAEFDGIDIIDFKVKSMSVRFLLVLLISQKSTESAVRADRRTVLKIPTVMHTEGCFQVVSEENPDDPLQETFIGPEKLLSLYTEMNWGNYCLSYLLTSRDFSGVLGLAWEGKPGEMFVFISTQASEVHEHLRIYSHRLLKYNFGIWH